MEKMMNQGKINTMTTKELLEQYERDYDYVKFKSALLSNKGEGKTAKSYTIKEIINRRVYWINGGAGNLEEQIEKAMIEYASLTSSEEVEKLKAEIKELQKSDSDIVKHYMETCKNYEEENTQLKGEINILNGHIKPYKDENDSLLEDNGIIMKENQKLQSRIKELESTPNVGDELSKNFWIDTATLMDEYRKEGNEERVQGIVDCRILFNRLSEQSKSCLSSKVPSECPFCRKNIYKNE